MPGAIDFRQLGEDSSELIVVLDDQFRFIYVNPAAERQIEILREGISGRVIWDVLPDLVGTPIAENIVRAAAERVIVDYGTHYPPLDRWYRIRCVPQPDGGMIVFAHDITEPRQATQRLRTLFDSKVVGVIFWNLDTGQITDANDMFLSMVDYTRYDLAAGQLNFRAMTPPEWTERNEEAVTAIRRDGAAVPYEKEYFRKDGSRVPILIGGTRFEESGAEGFSYILDITERKQAEEFERAVAQRDSARLQSIFMQAPAFMATLRGPQHVFEMANPPYFKLIGRSDIVGKPVAEALPEVVGQGFIDLLDHVYRTGEPFVGNDIPIAFQMEPGSPPEERILDFNYQPLFEEDGSISGILAHGIDLTDRKRLEQEHERLLEEQRDLLAEARAQAEREALLNQIGAAVRAELEPEAILSATVSVLGQGMRADRCYFVRYNQTRDIAEVDHEWLRDETIETLTGRPLRMSSFSVDRDPAYTAGRTHAVEDVVTYAPEDTSPLLALNIRSLLRVPIEVGDQMTALAVSMAFEPRVWTNDEVRLLENVASLLHSALESALVQQRERNIAKQLQDALLPPPPNDLPGLALASLYQPALAEAGVGGDFFDVFPVEKGCTALVVADLSGKGLQAASQVALVRNMLRYALYNGRTVAEAITGLHNTLVEFDLLTGFATLFIGMYDDRQNTLTYVNCGQEPALVWRAATGEVELLLPTGPVLGGFAGAPFAEKITPLAPGDVWTAFSDGMTEIGPNRRDLLGIEGLAPLFAACCAAAANGGSGPEAGSPAAILGNLIARIKDFAQNSGLQDDLCALLGVCKTPGTR